MTQKANCLSGHFGWVVFCTRISNVARWPGLCPWQPSEPEKTRLPQELTTVAPVSGQRSDSPSGQKLMNLPASLKTRQAS